MDTVQLFNNYGATVSLNWESTLLLLTTRVQVMREIINDPLAASLCENSFMSAIDCTQLSFLKHGKKELSWLYTQLMLSQAKSLIAYAGFVSNERGEFMYRDILKCASHLKWLILVYQITDSVGQIDIYGETCLNDHLLCNFVQCIIQTDPGSFAVITQGRE